MPFCAPLRYERPPVLPPSQTAKQRGSRVVARSARLRLALPRLAPLAPTRLPLVATLGLEMGILGKKPQDLDRGFL
jgi:hypothetical protein